MERLHAQNQEIAIDIVLMRDVSLENPVAVSMVKILKNV